MTPCCICKSLPVLETSSRGWRYVCPRRNRRTGRTPTDLVVACPADSPLHWRRSERAAAATWELHQDPDHVIRHRKHEVATLTVCPACGLRGEHVCLSGSGADRDSGRCQWWSEQHDHAWTDEEDEAR
jgi:hypothetical protein